jgi:hypothetical protein
MNGGAVYQIQVREMLGDEWTEWFAPLTITHGPDGGATLTGPLADQTALHGMLAKVRNLNLTLLSVERITSHLVQG